MHSNIIPSITLFVGDVINFEEQKYYIFSNNDCSNQKHTSTYWHYYYLHFLHLPRPRPRPWHVQWIVPGQLRLRSRSAAVAAPRLWLLPLRSGRRNAKVRCESWLLPLPLLRLPCSSNLHNVRNIVVSVDSHPFLCYGEWFISDCLRTRKKEICKELISQVLWSYHPSISIQFFIGLFDRKEIQIMNSFLQPANFKNA